MAFGLPAATVNSWRTSARIDGGAASCACTCAVGNPKAILVFTAFFPQFVVPGAYASSYVLLGVTFLVFELVAIALYALLGARMRRLANGSRAMRWFNRVSGSMMVGFGLILAFTRRPAG